MRIIGGRHRGRRLAEPADRSIRPTGDRLRERLFNILSHRGAQRLEGALVLDLFAGTGALGLEALSRGAAFTYFVDDSPTARTLIQRNVQALGVEVQTAFIAADATRLPPAPGPVDLILMDPPYGKGLAAPALSAALKAGWCHKTSLIALEQARRDPMAWPEGFRLLDQRDQGRSRMVILEYVR